MYQSRDRLVVATLFNISVQSTCLVITLVKSYVNEFFINFEREISFNFTYKYNE